MGHVEKNYAKDWDYTRPKVAPAPQGISPKRYVNEREEPEIKTIEQKKVSDTCVIAIVWSKYWFSTHNLGIIPGDFVVCKWYDYYDGIKSNIEGKQTIAICQKKEDAYLIYNNTKEF